MTSVRIGNYGGGVISVDGEIYTLDASQPSDGAIDAVPTVINIVGYTWGYDDDNVYGGTNHRTWTACEMGICRYGTGNQSTVEFNGAGVYVSLYAAPSAGIIRIFVNVGGSQRFTIKVNGSQVFYGVIKENYFDARPVILSSGDAVTIAPEGGWGAGIYAYGWFLPNSY